MNIKVILLIFFLIIFPLFMIIDSVIRKWIKVKINKDILTVKKIFKRRRNYDLTRDLASWYLQTGYARFSGTAYILNISFINGDSYKIDSSYGLENYYSLFQELNSRYKNKKIKKAANNGEHS